MSHQQVPEKAVRIIMKDIFTHKLKPGTKLPSAKRTLKTTANRFKLPAHCFKTIGGDESTAD